MKKMEITFGEAPFVLYTTKLLDEFVRDTRDHRESWIDEQLKSGLEWMDEAIRAEDYRHLVQV